MSVLWIAVLAACVISFGQKWLGYQVPPGALERPRVARITALLPVALLGALVATQTLTHDGTVVADARIAGILVAAVLLWRRAPFLVVVLAGAAVTAGLRLLGLP